MTTTHGRKMLDKAVALQKKCKTRSANETTVKDWDPLYCLIIAVDKIPKAKAGDR